MEVNWSELLERMKKLDYPPNSTFNPQTLESQGKALSRAHKLLDMLGDVGFNKNSLLDIGSNRGWFAFTFGWFYIKAKCWFSEIIGIEPRKEYVNLAQNIRNAHGLLNVEFFCTDFESFHASSMFDVIHFGQCCHYMFRDGVRRKEDPLWFLTKAKLMAGKHIIIDGAFDGDQSVEYDAVTDKWPQHVKRMATIEFYAYRLRPEFRLIRYGTSGDPAPELKRFIAVFERV